MQFERDLKCAAARLTQIILPVFVDFHVVPVELVLAPSDPAGPRGTEHFPATSFGDLKEGKEKEKEKKKEEKSQLQLTFSHISTRAARLVGPSAGRFSPRGFFFR